MKYTLHLFPIKEKITLKIIPQVWLWMQKMMHDIESTGINIYYQPQKL